MKAEYARRRRRLMRRMSANSVALLPAAPTRTHSRDVDWPYRQDSDFLYLTGFPEPHALAMLLPGNESGEFVLFCRKRNPKLEVWEGRMTGLEGAREQYGADVAYSIERLDTIVPELLAGRDTVYYTLGEQPVFDQQVMGWISELRVRVREGVCPPRQCHSLDSLLHELRVIKSRTEVARMRRSCEIAARAHRRAMAMTCPGRYEYELEAELQYEHQRSQTRFAYPHIVASGPNACVLHYTENRRRMEAGDLVLVDSGGMHGDYASDLTRTWPVDGGFQPAQREIYELVLEAQRAAIARCNPGNGWQDVHAAATRMLTRGLVHLGLLSGTWQARWKEHAYRQYYMHNTGHWIGMDVHDAGEYKVDGHWRQLQPGMVTTVEPGLYFPPGRRGVPKRFRGIGVRIEDNVAIRRAGSDVLSSSLPSDPDEVCALVGTAVR